MKLRFIKNELIAAILFGFLLSFTAQSTHLTQTRTANQAPPSIPQPELVKLYVSALDEDNNFISKLNYFDFEITCDKVPQSISYFSKKDDPVGIVFLLDVSGSMREGSIYRKLLPHLSRFIEQSHPQNEYSIIGFNQQVGLNLPWTRDRAEVVNRLTEISNASTKGQTSLFDAIVAAIEQTKGRASKRGAILLASDGDDNASATKINDLQLALLRSTVPLYSVLLNQNYSTLGHWAGSNSGYFDSVVLLTRFSPLTGGTTLLPRNLKELELGFDHLAQELRHQYVLGFNPTCNHQGNKPHQVRLRIAEKSSLSAIRKTIQIRHREEYK